MHRSSRKQVLLALLAGFLAVLLAAGLGEAWARGKPDRPKPKPKRPACDNTQRFERPIPLGVSGGNINDI
ncbi:MAG: hypothetical protein JRI59_02365, partial [Deltaproteobacteria bacterium]|nr:hypothetical protein [Deltaproteobacteria bacterium]